MLINYFDEDYQSLMKYLEKKGEVYSERSDDWSLITVSGTFLRPDHYGYTTFYFRKKESDNKDYCPHVEIFSGNNFSLIRSISGQKEISLFLRYTEGGVQKLSRCSKVDNGIFLLQVDCRIINKPLLLKSNLLYNGKRSYGYISNKLELEIKRYSRLYNVEQNNIRLSLIRLFGFERLKFNSDDLEKYIQLKNKELSRCTEEELNKQIEKFFDPYNYPHYFKTEVCAYLGTEIAKQVEKGIHSGVADSALDSLNPDSSLQTLKVLALAAIGKFAIQ